MMIFLLIFAFISATCTMLGLFGLGAMNDAMPKLSHLKMNDIWFIGCNLFIFLSLAEFAFVNIVHRQEYVLYMFIVF